MTEQSLTAMIGATLVVSMLAGCGPQMLRPRASGESAEARPGQSLIVGQYVIETEGVPKTSIGLTPHRVHIGDEMKLFYDEIPTNGRTFALWVFPGVVCFARPTHGEPPKVLADKAPCVEIPEAGKSYYVGNVVWMVREEGGKVSATLDVRDRRESVFSSPTLKGIYPQTNLASAALEPGKTAAKYKMP